MRAPQLGLGKKEAPRLATLADLEEAQKVFEQNYEEASQSACKATDWALHQILTLCDSHSVNIRMRARSLFAEIASKYRMRPGVWRRACELGLNETKAIIAW